MPLALSPHGLPQHLLPEGGAARRADGPSVVQAFFVGAHQRPRSTQLSRAKRSEALDNGTFARAKRSEALANTTRHSRNRGGLSNTPVPAPHSGGPDSSPQRLTPCPNCPFSAKRPRATLKIWDQRKPPPSLTYGKGRGIAAIKRYRSILSIDAKNLCRLKKGPLAVQAQGP